MCLEPGNFMMYNNILLLSNKEGTVPNLNGTICFELSLYVVTLT